MTDRNLFMLVAVIALIALAILYLESAKPKTQPPIAPAQQAAPNQPAIDFSLYPEAPELVGISGYINTPDNLTIASLRGKVVLLDIWTYTCINCIRTLPYVESWHEKYAKDGLVVIGVHSPEFDFEKDIGNVKAAVEKYGIKYPVVLDSDRATWNAYQNQYWPRHYLIDANGRIRFDHIGEGGYDETEAQIVQLLSEAKKQEVPMNKSKPDAAGVDFRKVGTPEIYFGNLLRRAQLGNAPLFIPLGQEFNASTPAGDILPNVPYLDGSWINNADNVQLASQHGAIDIVFTAKRVHIVAGSARSSTLAAYVDSERQSSQKIAGQQLYTVAELEDYGTHRLRLEVEGKGFEIFTFTFG